MSSDPSDPPGLGQFNFFAAGLQHETCLDWRQNFSHEYQLGVVSQDKIGPMSVTYCYDWRFFKQP